MDDATIDLSEFRRVRANARVLGLEPGAEAEVRVTGQVGALIGRGLLTDVGPVDATVSTDGQGVDATGQVGDDASDQTSDKDDEPSPTRTPAKRATKKAAAKDD